MAGDYPVAHFFTFAKEGFINLGYSMLSPESNVEAIKRSSFINVECRIFKVPLGTWYDPVFAVLFSTHEIDLHLPPTFWRHISRAPLLEFHESI